MLDRKIKIRADLFFLGHKFKKPIGEMVCLGVSVEDSNPTQAFHVDQILQELFQIGSISKVSSISGGVLSNQDEFLDALIRKPLSLSQDGSKFPTSITTPDLWNRTKGACIGATFRNLQVGSRRRGGKNSRRPFAVKKSGFRKETLSPWLPREKFGKVLERSGPDEEVHLWQFLFQNFPISLGKTSRYNEKTAAAFSLEFGEMKNRLNGLLGCFLNKGAGIDDEDVRPRGIRGQEIALFRKETEDHFGID